jgi:hypothetical protein
MKLAPIAPIAPIALLVLIAATAAGCARTAAVATPASHPPPPTPLQPTRHVPCFDGHQRLAGPKEVRRFHAVAAVSCIDGERIYPGHRQWDIRTRRVALHDVSALQRFYERPSRHDLPKGGMCLLVARFILTPTLVDAQGRWLTPKTPVDACGAPLGKLPKVHWHAVSVRKLKLQVSAAALASHCAMSVKDVPAGAIGPLERSPGGSLFVREPKTAGICIFRTEDFEVGHFVRGFALDHAKTRRLVEALTGPAPRGACANQPLFAVVAARNDPTEEGVWVELGGCFRVAGFRGGYTAGGSANPAVVRSILGR